MERHQDMKEETIMEHWPSSLMLYIKDRACAKDYNLQRKEKVCTMELNNL